VPGRTHRIEVNHPTAKGGGFSLPLDTMRRENRQVYIYPASHIASSHVVCICFVSTGYASKHGLFFSVGLVYMPTAKTSPARVLGVNNGHWDTKLPCFVFDKRSKLTEGPIVQSFPLLFPGLNPRANMLEVFKPYFERVAFSFVNDAFRNIVVNPRLETALSAPAKPQAPYGGTGSPTLQGASVLDRLLAIGFYLRARIGFSCRVCSDVNNSEINAKYALRRNQTRLVNVNRAGNVPLSADKHQIDLTLAVWEQTALIFTTLKGDGETSVNSPQAYSAVFGKADYPVVIWLRGPFTEFTLYFPAILELVRISNFCDASHGRLCSQTKAVADLTVICLMQSILSEYLSFESAFGKPVARLVAALKRITQSPLLVLVRLKLKVNHKLHTFKYGVQFDRCQPFYSGGRASSLRLNPRVSGA
jgi:hypothetical protein